MKVKEMVLCGLLSAILLISQVAFAGLPNIELVSLLVIVYTLVFGRKTLIMIYTFALLEGIVYGFGVWWVMYLYVWTILYGITTLFRKQESALFWATVSGCFGLGFGALCAIPYAIAGGIGAGVAWWTSGILFDITHGIGNFIIALVLWKPMLHLMRKLNQSIA